MTPDFARKIQTVEYTAVPWIAGFVTICVLVGAGHFPAMLFRHAFFPA